MLSIQFEGKDSSSGQEGSGSALAKAVTRDSGLPGIDVSSASATVVQEGGRSSLSTLDISRKIQAGRINRQITVGVSLLQGIYDDCSTPTSNSNTSAGSEGKRMKGVVSLSNGTDAFVVKTRNKKTKNKEASISKSKKVVMPDSFANLDTGDMEAENASTATARADLDDKTGSLSRTESLSKEGTLSGVESCIKDLSSSGKEVRRVQSSLMEEESREYLRKGFEQVSSILFFNTTPSPTWEEWMVEKGGLFSRIWSSSLHALFEDDNAEDGQEDGRWKML